MSYIVFNVIDCYVLPHRCMIFICYLLQYQLRCWHYSYSFIAMLVESTKCKPSIALTTLVRLCDAIWFDKIRAVAGDGDCQKQWWLRLERWCMMYVRKLENKHTTVTGWWQLQTNDRPRPQHCSGNGWICVCGYDAEEAADNVII